MPGRETDLSPLNQARQDEVQGGGAQDNGDRNLASVEIQNDEADEEDPLLESLGSFWHTGEDDATLGEMYRSVQSEDKGDKGASFWSRFLFFMGPGGLVAVGYMDPGNWATDLAGGSAYNYRLLFVIVVSSVMAMFLQSLALRLGLVARLDLAQACRAQYSQRASFILWIACEIAITACDLAEVIGSAVAMKLLFGLPMLWGVLVTALDVLIIISLGLGRIRVMEYVVAGLIAVIGVCFAIELYWSKPDLLLIIKGSLIPSSDLILDPGMLYIGVGILGATVMPHNLYLHSSVVQTRDVGKTAKAVQEAISMSLLDSNLALTFAFFVNGAILILAASTFYKNGHKDVADLEQAYTMLHDILGTRAASVLFGTALLVSGQQSTFTGTLAGQIVMEGFVQWHLRPEVRRLVTRLAAVVPAVLVILFAGEAAVNDLLVLSQVVLSLQLPCAVFPLVMFTSNPDIMGEFVNSLTTKVVAWAVAIVILVLNFVLVVQIIAGP
mmetsp:Transcript_1606/g.2845  ORF Transcript_1606/g.2845 Transcript_1606/m.2845 type:complete len:497 (+) Transcript_1606:39-1529(+)